MSVILVKAVALTVVLLVVVLYLAQGRGVPWMFGLLTGVSRG